jgi:hypothetical protein
MGAKSAKSAIIPALPHPSAQPHVLDFSRLKLFVLPKFVILEVSRSKKELKMNSNASI